MKVKVKSFFFNSYIQWFNIWSRSFLHKDQPCSISRSSFISVLEKNEVYISLIFWYSEELILSYILIVQ